jgi:uncharacterized protein YndB with AHSA1/START domain
VAKQTNAISESPSLELVISRVFNAPRSLVFKAWTEPEHMARWWGPNGFTLPVCEMDARTGGNYRFCMRSPEGSDHRSQGIFREVVEPERIVFTGAWTDADGKPTSTVMVTTVTFEEHAGKTKLTLRQAGLESVTARDSHRGGWSSSLERLTEYLATL